MENKSWIKKQIFDKDFKIIQCKSYDPIKDYKADKNHYVLIKVYKETKEIGVAICNYQHIILKEFRGKKSQDIYNEIFKHDYINSLAHAAYLGKELKKAEFALENNQEYTQE